MLVGPDVAGVDAEGPLHMTDGVVLDDEVVDDEVVDDEVVEDAVPGAVGGP